MEPYLWQQAEIKQTALSDLQEASGLVRPIALALVNRGLTADKLAGFLKPALKDLTDPYLLGGTEKAAARLWQAARNQEQVLIHGDYDADGITAAILLSRVLGENGVVSKIFLPHRIDDGYGLTSKSIKKAGSTNFSLLITVDCGITSIEAVKAARDQGIDVIVTDHHVPGKNLPAASAIINPKLPGTPAVIRELAGVGVAFKLCHGFLKYGREHQLGGLETDLRDYLDLVALGTVADIVPLLGENRCLVKHGLPILSRQQRPGIRALCERAGLGGEELGAPDIAFRLAPRINAPGRMGDASQSIALLSAQSMSEATPIATLISETNNQRRQQENEVLAEAENQLREARFSRGNSSIVVCGKKWHPGVLGIVAARLSRTHNRPAVVLSRDQQGYLCGSVRSIPGLNAIEALQLVEGLLERYGGHAMAAGLSLKQENLAGFKQLFEDHTRELMQDLEYRPQLHCEGTIELFELSDRFFTEHKMLEPFGHSNPEPIFICRQAFPEFLGRAGRDHSRGTISDPSGGSIDFIAFRRTPENFPSPPWDLVIKPQLNNFNGSCKPQVEVIDLRTARLGS